MPRSADVSLELLLENKKEYLQHLHQLLTEPIYAELQALYQVAQKHSAADKLLEGFQDQLTKIPHWNADQVLALKERVYLRMHCDYFQELVKATFMVFMKLHLATLAETPSHLKVKVPNMETYIHRVLVATARLLWKKPYIFYHHVRTLEKQKNLLQCEAMIHKAIAQTIQGSLPLNEIFRFVSQETSVRPKTAAAAADDSPDSATDATGEEQSDTSEEHSDATGEEQSDAASEEESEASGEEESEESEEESDASDATDEEQSEQPGANGEEEKKEQGDVIPVLIKEKEDIIESVASRESRTSAASQDSGYKSDSEASAASHESHASEAELNLIKPIEITEKDTRRHLRRPHVRPIVSKLHAPRPNNAFF